MSFKDQDQDQGQPADQLTFKVGDRDYDPESAANKIQNADTHIAKLEAENAEFRAKLEQSLKLEEALEVMKANNASVTPENVQPSENTTGLSEEQIAALTHQEMEKFLANDNAKKQQAQAEQLSKETYKKTASALVDIYGDKVDEAVSNKAQELGVPANQLFEMANNPVTAKLLLETMTPKGGNSEQYPSGSINNSNVYGDRDESLIDTSQVERVTSSTIVDALRKHGATY